MAFIVYAPSVGSDDAGGESTGVLRERIARLWNGLPLSSSPGRRRRYYPPRYAMRHYPVECVAETRRL